MVRARMRRVAGRGPGCVGCGASPRSALHARFDSSASGAWSAEREPDDDALSGPPTLDPRPSTPNYIPPNANPAAFRRASAGARCSTILSSTAMSAFKVPPLGESIVEATISRWLKREGDTVAAGETLVELETDKVTVEVPALKAGVLTRRLKQEGDVVTVGAELAQIDDTASA